MSDVYCRIDGRAGRLTLNRPIALNALTYPMILEIENALDLWLDNPDIALVVIDATGDKAFCAGGDIQEMYDRGRAGDLNYGHQFWRDEYRLNAKISSYSKPYVALMQGFTMGGGVGVSCHGSHRVVCENSQIAMPEVSIGLIPDVGGTLLLARAPGHLGEYLGTTANRMNAADAIYAGFADYYVPFTRWPELIRVLCETGDTAIIHKASQSAMKAPISAYQTILDQHFSGETINDIIGSLQNAPPDFAAETKKRLYRNSPLSVAVTIPLIRLARAANDIHSALMQEFRFTARSVEHGDFVEGIRAAIIEKDHAPHWHHSSVLEVPQQDLDQMLASLGPDELHFTKENP